MIVLIPQDFQEENVPSIQEGWNDGLAASGARPKYFLNCFHILSSDLMITFFQEGESERFTGAWTRAGRETGLKV